MSCSPLPFDEDATCSPLLAQLQEAGAFDSFEGMFSDTDPWAVPPLSPDDVSGLDSQDDVLYAPIAAPAVQPSTALPSVPLVVIDDSDSDGDSGSGTDVDIDDDEGPCFALTMPDGASLRFSNTLAAIHAFQCYLLDGGHVFLHRGDLAAAFSKDGLLGCLSGARTQTRRFLQVLAQEGLAVHAAYWAALRPQVLSLIATARAGAKLARA
jgi:hypothetical protein